MLYILLDSDYMVGHIDGLLFGSDSMIALGTIDRGFKRIIVDVKLRAIFSALMYGSHQVQNPPMLSAIISAKRNISEL